MSYTDKQIIEEYNNLRVKLETARGKYKEKFAKLKEDIESKLDPKYYDELGIVIDDLTAEHWLPSLYTKDFNKEAYTKEREEANAFLEKLYNFKEDLKDKVAKEMGLSDNEVK